MRWVWTAIALAAGSSVAHAGVEVGAGAPFTADELRRALAARGFDEDVAVAASGDDAVEVTTADGSWRIELGAARGAAAARLVALHLALEPAGAIVGPPADAVAPAEELDVALADPPDGGLAEPTGVTDGAPAVGAPSRARWRLDAVVGAGAGVERDDLAVGGVRVDVARTRGSWRLALGLGWLGGVPRAPAGGQALDADLAFARLLAGIDLGRVELAAGPIVGLLTADGDAGGPTVGLAATARVAWPIGHGASVLVGVDADALHRRMVGRIDGVPFAASPRLAISAVAGLGVELGR